MILYLLFSLGSPILILTLWGLVAGANPERLTRKSTFAVAAGICGSLFLAGIAALLILWRGREQGSQHDLRPVMYSFFVVGNSIAGLATVGFLWLIRPGQRETPTWLSHRASSLRHCVPLSSDAGPSTTTERQASNDGRATRDPLARGG